MSGVAAQGLALANAAVQVKCVAGTGAAVTGITGAYTITVASPTLPCVVQATSADGKTVLHSFVVAAPSGLSTANISPLTELLLAQLTGKLPSAVFADFSGTALTAVQSANLTTALAAVATSLNSAVTLGNLDPVQGLLVAATATTAGNAHDQLLDLLKLQLRFSGKTLQDLVDAVVAGNAANVSGALESAYAKEFVQGVTFLSISSSRDTKNSSVMFTIKGTSGPVNGVYPASYTLYSLSLAGQWEKFEDTYDSYLLTTKGWYSNKLQNNLVGTLRQTAADTMTLDLPNLAVVSLKGVFSTTTAVAANAGIAFPAGGLPLPTGARQWKGNFYTETPDYEIIGQPTDLAGVTSLTTLRALYPVGSTSRLPWKNSSDGLSLQFGPGTTTGSLVVRQSLNNCFAAGQCPDITGSWTLSTINGVEILALDMGTAYSNTKQQRFYTVGPTGELREGLSFQTGLAGSYESTRYNNIARDAILKATNLPASP